MITMTIIITMRKTDKRRIQDFPQISLSGNKRSNEFPFIAREMNRPTLHLPIHLLSNQMNGHPPSTLTTLRDEKRNRN